MSDLAGGPRFNLKAVVQQTGIKPDTLRAWERRYGLPAPERSTGRHRLYSQRDIDTINWLSARLKEGLRIKQAVDMWRGIEAEGQDPLLVGTAVARQPVPAPVAPPQGAAIQELREAWLAACLAYDEQAAEQIVNQAFALFRPETVAVELLQQGIAQIGEGWYRGEVTVQQEHFCSALVVRRLEALVMAAPLPTRPGRILVACPPREDHVISLLLLTYLLRRRGWDVVYLGANVPVEQVQTTVAAAEPQLVISAAQQIKTAASLAKAARRWQAEGVVLAYGGLVFNRLPDLRRRIAGHFLGERLEDAPLVIESLMVSPRPAPSAEAVAEAYLQARDAFTESRALIEAEVVQSLRPSGMAHHHLATANRELGLNIDAALALGDMGCLGTDIDWVAGLLRNYRLPPEALYGYLAAYRQAANNHMAEQGLCVVDWFDGLLAGKPPG